MDLTQAFNPDTIQLEPRLQEYMRRKKFNNQNSIRADIREEQEFAITPDDMKMIRKHTKGVENLYNGDTIGKLYRHDHMIRPNTKFFNENNDPMKDDRFQRIQKKMESHKKAARAINNLDMMDSEYTTCFNSDPYDSTIDGAIDRPYIVPNNNMMPNNMMPNNMMPNNRVPNNRMPNNRVPNNMMPNNRVPNNRVPNNRVPNNRVPNNLANNDLSRYMMDSRDLAVGPSRPHKQQQKSAPEKSNDRGIYRYDVNNRQPNPNTYHHPPSISNNQYLTPQKVNGGLPHRHDINQLIGTIDEYQKNLNKTTGIDNFQNGQVDMDTKQMRGGNNMKSRRETNYQYNSVPMMYGMGTMDVCLEDSLRGNVSDTSKKTAGYRNMFENSFQYISPDISDPNHTVGMYPNSTRGTGKEIARPSTSNR